MTSESTPDLEDLQQENERDAIVEVPVRIVKAGSLQVHILPARDAIMRSVTIPIDGTVQQIVGKNLRRSSITIWAHGEADGDMIYIGTDKNEVESNSSAQIWATAVGSLATANTIRMTHAMPIWVKNQPNASNPVTLSFIAEDWAD